MSEIVAYILVHPGSCCGSANFNMGIILASAARSRLIDTLDHIGTSPGHELFVLDGDLSDELGQFPALDHAIKAALARCAQNGRPSMRLQADDPDQVQVAQFLLDNNFFRDRQVKLMGAWAEPDNDNGCVTSVKQVLDAGGIKADRTYGLSYAILVIMLHVADVLSLAVS